MLRTTADRFGAEREVVKAPVIGREPAVASSCATVGLSDRTFDHVPSICPTTPGLLRMDRSGEPHRIKVFTDLNLDRVFCDASPTKLAWLLEPSEFHPDAYAAAISHDFAQQFDFIM